MLYFINWITTNGKQVLDVLTLVGTVLGFLLTYREVKKSRKVVQETLEKVSLRILFNEVSASVRLITELKESCRIANWDRATDKSSQLRITLASLVENPSLSESESVYISTSIDDTSLVLEYIEGITMGTKRPPLTRKMQVFLNDFEVQLIRLESKLRNPLMEVKNEKRKAR